MENVEGIRFNGYHSSEKNLSLIERIANPPEEKEILEDIPFMQGQLDFSNILGQRVFNNRELVYEFVQVNYDYGSRKVNVASLKNWLMSVGKQKLHDDFNKHYHYVGKCKSVEAIDSYHGTSYRVTFEAYPFMISNFPEGHDIWDVFNFELDYSQHNKFIVNGRRTVNIKNVGTNTISPIIVTTAPMSIIKEGVTYQLGAGETKSYELMLKLGDNPMTIQGNGTIEFQFYKELV